MWRRPRGRSWVATPFASLKTNRTAVSGSGQGLDSANWCASSTSVSISASMASISVVGAAFASDDRGAKASDRAAGLPGIDLVARAVGVVAHAFGVWPGAVGPAFEQGRAVAISRALDGSQRLLVDSQHIIAVQVDALDAVARPSIGHAGAGGRVGEGHFGCVLIVFADEKDRELPDAGHVEAFVKGTVVDGAVAEEGDGHVIALQKHEAVAGAGGLEDAGPDDAAGAHHADFRGEEMHAAASSLRAAGGAAEQLGEQLAGCEPLGKGMAVTAVGAEDDVVFLQMRADARGDCLLPDVGMAGAVDQPALMRPGQLLFTAANQHHRSIEGEQLVVVQIGRCIRWACWLPQSANGDRRSISRVAGDHFGFMVSMTAMLTPRKKMPQQRVPACCSKPGRSSARQ